MVSDEDQKLIHGPMHIRIWRIWTCVISNTQNYYKVTQNAKFSIDFAHFFV